jgi:hypothetical protein
MRKLTMTLTALVLVLGTMAVTASAQTQAPVAASFSAQLENATPFVEQAACTSFRAQFKDSTPFVKQAACNGRTGYCGCGPGWISACAPRCCRCVPCY